MPVNIGMIKSKMINDEIERRKLMQAEKQKNNETNKDTKKIYDGVKKQKTTGKPITKMDKVLFFLKEALQRPIC